MQRAIRIMAIGLDYRRYSRFKMFCPLITKMRGNRYQIFRSENMKRLKISKDDVRFCIDFIIESALKLYEFDYSIEDSWASSGFS